MSREPVQMKVVGFCPQGCGESLLVDDVGQVVCCANDCPRPDAVAVILLDSETEHVVSVGEFGYTIQHPLRERAHGDLFECSILAEVSDTVDERRGEPGRYRVRWTEDRELEWELVGDGDAQS